MKVLYHGTRYLHPILARGCLRPRKIGEKHVSLTTKKYVAKYWAEIFRDDVFGFGHIITLDWAKLVIDGIDLRRYASDWARFDEYEIVSTKSIKPIMRYTLKIEQVPGSFLGPEELERIRPGFQKAREEKRKQIERDQLADC